MKFEFTVYSLASALTALVTLLLAGAAWRRRAVPTAALLALFMAAVTEWSLASAFEYAAVGIPAKVFWSKWEYLGLVSSPVLFVLFALAYHGLDRWRTRPMVAGLFVMPCLGVLLAWTNERHHLIWPGFTPSPAGQNLIIYQHGIGFWVVVWGYSYLALFTGTCLSVWAAFRFPRVYRAQSGAVVVAALFPWIGNLGYVTRLSPLPPGVDPTPMMLTLTSVALAWSIFHFRLFDLAPVARDALVETMADGVLVLDAQARVADSNPAARRLLPLAPGQNLPLFHGSDSAARLAQAALAPEGRAEIALHDAQGRHIEVSISALRDRRGQETGRLVVFRDVTARRQAEDELRRANDRLKAQLVEIELLQAELREQTVRDSLTGLFNRRYLDRALAQALAAGTPFSIVLLDLDHFKALNDTHGHRAGDAVLRALGAFLQAQACPTEIACRFGGEEFAVVLPGAGPEEALRRAEAWRAAWQETPIVHAGLRLRSTLSGGVSASPNQGDSGDDLLHAADIALYAAKDAGRNCIRRSLRAENDHPLLAA